MRRNLFKLMHTQTPGFYKSLKVGLIANGFLRQILEDGLVSPTDITDLQDGIKCNQIFKTKISFPVLSTKPITDNSHPRTYSEPVVCPGGTYYLTNDWYKKNKQLLIDWILQF